jgi:xanthine dehydrogenase accessory factor
MSVYQALELEGVPREAFERVHAPVGLEIGPHTPEEIAISIAAELIGVRRGAAALAHKSASASAGRARAVPTASR